MQYIHYTGAIGILSICDPYDRKIYTRIYDVTGTQTASISAFHGLNRYCIILSLSRVCARVSACVCNSVGTSLVCCHCVRIVRRRNVARERKKRNARPDERRSYPLEATGVSHPSTRPPHGRALDDRCCDFYLFSFYFILFFHIHVCYVDPPGDNARLLAVYYNMELYTRARARTKRVYG